MVRGPKRDIGMKLARPVLVLMLPFVALPILGACAERSDAREPCDRPINCPEKRPLPILY